LGWREGVSQAEVARQLGVKRQSVHEWAKVISTQDEKGLARVPTGRKPRLNAVQLTQLNGLSLLGSQIGMSPTMCALQIGGAMETPRLRLIFSEELFLPHRHTSLMQSKNIREGF